MSDFAADYDRLTARLAERGIAVENVIAALKAQHIETPSWGYGNSGTRFKVFRLAGRGAQGLREAGRRRLHPQAHRHRARRSPCTSPGTRPTTGPRCGSMPTEQGVRIGAINPNLFQDDDYKLGSSATPTPACAKQALAHMIECCEIMRADGQRICSACGSPTAPTTPGRTASRERKHRMERGAGARPTGTCPPAARMLIEYKFFEPAFYHTDLADWGMAYAMALKLGAQAQVLVDTGHHAQGTNIEHIVAFLLDEGRLGGFHFNARKYADDDLIVGTINPFELF